MSKKTVFKSGVIPIVVPVIVILLSSVIIVSKAKEYFQSAAIEGAPSVDLAADTDGDGFKDHVESNIGTDANKACGDNAWPVDFNNDGKVTVSDINTISQKVGTEYPTPGYNRYDFDLDGKVTSGDVQIVQSYYFKTCSQTSAAPSPQTTTGGGASQTGSTQASPITSVDLAADTDSDGFKDHVESNIGTDANKACGDNAWPVDFNNDGKVTAADILALSQKVGTEYPTPGYNRYDFDLDGKVTTKDVAIVQSYYSKTCSSAPQSAVGPTATPKPGVVGKVDIYSDKDKDGFALHVEQNIGTDPNKACGVKAWPVDFNDDGKVTVADVNAIVKKVGIEYPTPSYERFDFNLDGKVTGVDVAVVQAFYGQNCSDAGIKPQSSSASTTQSPAPNPGLTIQELLKKNTLAPLPRPEYSRQAAADFKDSDHDGFKDREEVVIGTDSLHACGENTWPVDFNSDGKVTSGDLNLIANKLGTEYPAPGYQRYDLNLDGKVNDADMNIVKSYYSKTCPKPGFLQDAINRMFGFRFAPKSVSTQSLSTANLDTDHDGFKDSDEVKIGTDLNKVCGENAWPVEFNNDGKVTVTDMNAVIGKIGTESTPGYNRYDLDLDGKVTTQDVDIVKEYYGRTCSDPRQLLYVQRLVNQIFVFPRLK